MTNPPSSQHDNIPFRDLFSLLKKGKYWILLSALSGALALSAFSLARPVMFKSEASFKDKGKAKDAFGASGLASLLVSGIASQHKSDAKSLMMSRKILERVVKKLGLQSVLHELPVRSQLRQKVSDNLKIEYYYLRKIQNYPIPDLHPEVAVENALYSKQTPLTLMLIFDGEGHFKVIDQKSKQQLGVGTRGIPFEGKDFAFVVRINKNPEAGTEYLLNLLPMDKVVESLRGRLSIIPDPDDDSLLQLTFNDPDRLLSARFLNALMSTYQEYQREEQDRISAEQITYLNRREKEMGKSLEQTLTAYASRLSEDVDDYGYIESEKGMELLSKELQILRQQQMEAELDLQRLEELEVNRPVYQTKERQEYFNNLVSRIRDLDAQSDQIELALRSSDSNAVAAWQESFSKQIEDLNELRRCSEDAKMMLASLDSGKYPLPSVSLMDHPNFLVSSWNKELNNCLDKLKQARPWETDTRKEELADFSNQFRGYLDHLLHYLEVSQKSIKERLEHQQAPHIEFQGINLNAASELYIAYSKQLSDLDNQVLQYQYMIDQLDKPGFEISSFSSVTRDDPVSLDLTKKASQYAVAIQDDSNHGIKEKERIQTELETLKKFYGLHLNQTVELSRLKQLQLKAKIESLQSAVLDLIQQQRSILVNQFNEAVDAQKVRLKQEKNLIARQIGEIQKELNKLPQKWASEKLIEHQINMNARMVEELTKLVESKNISFNLEIAQSAPLDLANPPVKPASPHLLLYATLGGILGLCASSGLLLLNAFIKGFTVSSDNLSSADVKIGGSLSRLQETEISVLSSLIKNNVREFAVIGDLDFSFARRLAERLSQQEKKLLVIELGAVEIEYSGSIIDHLFIDENSPEASNLSQVLKNAENDYDCVILSVSSKPLSLTAYMALEQVETAYILLKDETTIELQPLIRRSREQNLVFIPN